MDPQTRLSRRRLRLQELAAEFNGAPVAPVAPAAPVATPKPATAPQPDQTQAIADVMLELERKEETIRALVALVGDASDANAELESECEKHKADLASLLNVIFHSNPTTVVPPPLAIMDRRRVRFGEPLEPYCPPDSSESCV